MTDKDARPLPLNSVIKVPKDFISVYSLEQHVWADGGSAAARKDRKIEMRTIRDFLIDPVRPLLCDVFERMAAHAPDRPAGQGYWIEADFGSGKSHLLSFIAALALGRDAAWQEVRRKEKKSGVPDKDSLYRLWQNGLKQKYQKGGKGIMVVVKTLVGLGDGPVGMGGESGRLVEYILDAVQDQFRAENGRVVSLYPAEALAERFLEKDLTRYKSDLEQFLGDPRYFDEDERESLEDFLDGLKEDGLPGVRRDCGDKLWRFYESCLETRPLIPAETGDVLRRMVETLLREGCQGLVLVLDEVSLFMKNRTENQRIEDEKTLLTLSNRLTRRHGLPVWTVCAAQQKLESGMGDKNIIADERLKRCALLNSRNDFYDIALGRVREIKKPSGPDAYWRAYKTAFTWPGAAGRDRFDRFFPFYPPAVDVVRAVSRSLTTLRSSLYFLHLALKDALKEKSCELVTLWRIFRDVVDYAEDAAAGPSGVASVRMRWAAEWQAFETAMARIDAADAAEIKRYRRRCEKIVQTLFLYHIAGVQPEGLRPEDILNAVMEWKDHDDGRRADKTDNLDHYEILLDKLDLELSQIVKGENGYLFTPVRADVDFRAVFSQYRAEAEQDERLREQAWETLLDGVFWNLENPVDGLARLTEPRDAINSPGPERRQKIRINWRGREVAGTVFLAELGPLSRDPAFAPEVDAFNSDEDFAVYAGLRPCAAAMDAVLSRQKDGRVLFWTPDAPTMAEQALLLDLAACLRIMDDCRSGDDARSGELTEQAGRRLKDQAGKLAKTVSDRFGRGRMAAVNFSAIPFAMQGGPARILEPALTRILDAVYLGWDLAFASPAPFTDDDALNIINGLVKSGTRPRGGKPDKVLKSLQHFGAALHLVTPGDENRLDASDARHAGDILAWIKSRAGQAGREIPVDAVYKNFMGSGIPGNANYGLSRRLVDLYLLCLVRKGDIRILADRRTVPDGIIDAATMADIRFNRKVLAGMKTILPMTPPEGWRILAPFAAVLLDDPGVKDLRLSADVQTAVERMREALQTQGLKAGRTTVELEDIFTAAGMKNPLAEETALWQALAAAPVSGDHPAENLLRLLDKTFGYHVANVKTALHQDLADFARRKTALASAETFAGVRRDILAAVRYARLTPKGKLKSAELNTALAEVKAAVGRLPDFLDAPARLVSELLAPLNRLRGLYTEQFMAAFDRLAAGAAQAEEMVRVATTGRAALALNALNRVDALPRIDAAALEKDARGLAAGLFPRGLSPNQVKAALQTTPFPEGCERLIAEEAELAKQNRRIEEAAALLFDAALLGRAEMLIHPKCRRLLEKEKPDAFISSVLAAGDAAALAGVLKTELAAHPEKADLLNRRLMTLKITPVKLTDFTPDMILADQEDIPRVVAQFRRFLENRMGPPKKRGAVVLKIEPS